MKKIVGCSACLLGLSCRYNATAKPHLEVIALSKKIHWIPFCPEQLGGLSTPRSPCEISNNTLLTKEGKDCTAAFKKGALETLLICQTLSISTVLLKEGSPSCGVHQRYDGTFSKRLISGSGLTASLLKQHAIVLFSENELEKLIEHVTYPPHLRGGGFLGSNYFC